MPRATVDAVLAASQLGERDADNAARHGVSVTSVRRWRRKERLGTLDRANDSSLCPRCDGRDLDGEAYAEMLGWYLGDGYIVRGRRGVYLMEIYQDERYVEDLGRLLDLFRRIKPGARPHLRRRPGCRAVRAYSTHWPCLFPQHGPGRKHERTLHLEPWQQQLVNTHPGAFLRGLLHSDGCRVRNWARRPVAGRLKRYDYPRWQFSNASPDIRRFFCETLDLVGVPWRQSAERVISVSTRAGVARLDALVGPKR